MHMDLPIEPLRTFVTIAACGSFTKAAATLHRTQPALSMQMKRLEEQLGTPLLARSGRRTTLTEAGALLLDYAQRILDLNEQALSKLAVVEAEGAVSVGILEEIALGPLVELLTQFGRLCEKVHLEIVVSMSTDLVQRIESDDLCLAVANESFGKGDTVSLWQEPYAWACDPDFDWASLDPLPLVLDPLHDTCEIRDVALRKLNEARREWYVAFSSSSLAAMQAAVRAGLGVGLMPRSALLPDLRVLGLPEGFPPIDAAPIGLYRSKKATSDAAHLLADFLCEHLRQAAEPLSPVSHISS